MQKKLLWKTLIVALLALLLVIPLRMIEGIVSERQTRQAAVVQEVAAAYAGRQRIVGPVLVLPFVEEYVSIAQAGKPAAPMRESGVAFVFPETLLVTADLRTDFKQRGLFRALVYDVDADLSGEFRLAGKLPKAKHPGGRMSWGPPHLSIGLEDTRGISGEPTLTIDEQHPPFEQGAGMAGLGGGIHAKLDAPASDAAIAFAARLSLRGTEQFALAPLAGSTSVRIASAWPHPQFGGRFLPDPRTQQVRPDGFQGHWSVTSLATRAREQFLEAAAGRGCPQFSCLESIELRLIEPISIYSMSDRALKYGFLFVWLSFAAFFLFETAKRLPIHPAQYTLVGLALALFFLLLLSLSEHVEFALAYAAASAACVGLIAYYLSSVLRSARRGCGFGALLAGLFAALYGLLASEDNALLMGSLLLFGLLAATMVATRRLDWYRDTGAPEIADTPPAG